LLDYSLIIEICY